MTFMSNDAIEIEMDFGPRNTAPVQPMANDLAPLDMTDSGGDQRCVDCSTVTAVDERGRCQACVSDLAPIAMDFGGIAAESRANSVVSGAGSMAGGQLAGVGFTSKEGYITVIRNGVPAHTHASYLTTLRARYGMTSGDLADLPGPMAVSTLPVGAGIVHIPTGPGIFEPGQDRRFKVGAAPASEQDAKVRVLSSKDLIAGAIAEGHGAIFGWRGEKRIARGEIAKALETIGHGDWAPRATSARAQAGRAVQALASKGYDVHVERKAAATELASGVSRWTVGNVNHGGAVGDAYGKTVLLVTLTDATLSCEGDEYLAAIVREDFNTRIAGEIYQSSDITTWLGGILTAKLDAVRFGIGWYVPAKHTAAASQLCAAVRDAGFGCDWICPGLPVASCDELRDGILRGLTDEVGTLLGRLENERTTAKDLRKTGDIGSKRAGTFLAELREIGKRVVAYGEVLGPDRVVAARESVRLAIVSLETLLGDDYLGIGERFSNVWDEIERDRMRDGGTL